MSDLGRKRTFPITGPKQAIADWNQPFPEGRTRSTYLTAGDMSGRIDGRQPGYGHPNVFGAVSLSGILLLIIYSTLPRSQAFDPDVSIRVCRHRSGIETRQGPTGLVLRQELAFIAADLFADDVGQFLIQCEQ